MLLKKRNFYQVKMLLLYSAQTTNLLVKKMKSIVKKFIERCNSKIVGDSKYHERCIVDLDCMIHVPMKPVHWDNALGSDIHGSTCHCGAKFRQEVSKKKKKKNMIMS